MTELQRKLTLGQTALSHDPQFGYLKEVLKQLEIPVSSQLLTFSKTSLQRPLIGPDSPRAIYFNDDAYVGFVRGGVLELIVPDEKLGLVFYRLDQQKTERPQFRRETSQCLTCHSSTRTKHIPGLQARSMLVDPKGQPVIAAGSFRTSQASPLTERWGGWYVTGTHGATPHLGNFHLPSSERPRSSVENLQGLNQVQLPGHVDQSTYLSPHSDIVALMVFEHQLDAHNYISRVNYAWQISQHVNAGDELWKDECETLLKHLLFVDEVELKHPIRGTSDFAKEFAARGPFDKEGQSLRQFDLKARLFKFPCSYVLHSQAFYQLPNDVKAHLYRRIHKVLTDREASPVWSRLSPDDRRQLLEILPAVKPDLKQVWKNLEKVSTP